MTQKLTLSDLLAYRDGEPLTEDVQAALDQDPALADQLQRSIELRHELNALPAEIPPPELWEQIQASAPYKAAMATYVEPSVGSPESAQESGQTDLPSARSNAPLTLAATGNPEPAAQSTSSPQSQVSWFASPQLRLATAASVFMVGVLVSALWLRGLPDASPEVGSGQIALQTPLQRSSGLATLVDQSRRLEEAVQSQVVSAGAEPSRAQRALMFRIADLDAELNSLQQEAMHPELKERLWRQRVALLETLMEIQRFQMLDQADF